MNTNIKRVVLGALLLLGLVNAAHAGYVATPAIGGDCKTIYIWIGGQGNPNLPPEASSESIGPGGAEHVALMPTPPFNPIPLSR